MAKSDKEQLTVVLNLRISAEDDTQLRELAGALPLSHAARVALRLGMRQIADDRTLLLDEDVAKRGPKPGARRGRPE